MFNQALGRVSGSSASTVHLLLYLPSAVRFTEGFSEPPLAVDFDSNTHPIR